MRFMIPIPNQYSVNLVAANLRHITLRQDATGFAALARNASSCYRAIPGTLLEHSGILHGRSNDRLAVVGGDLRLVSPSARSMAGRFL